MTTPFVMPRLLVLPVFFGLFVVCVHGQELPKKNGAADIDIEPKLMLNDLPDQPLPALDPANPAAAANANAAPSMDVAKLEAELEKAKKNAAWRDRLYKAGALSKVEAEQSALKIVRITKDLENARLQALTHKVEDTRAQLEKDASVKANLTDAETALATATTVANEASAKWDEAQRAAAELRLQRERKLLAAGAGSRSSVKRAEAAVQSLAPATGRPSVSNQ